MAEQQEKQIAPVGVTTGTGAAGTAQVGSFDRSNAVLFLGLTLLVVNLWLTPEWLNVIRSAFKLSPKQRTDTSAPPVTVIDLSLQGLLVLLLWALAKAGEEAGNLALLFLLALWLGWLLTNGPHLAAALGVSAPAPTGPSASDAATAAGVALGSTFNPASQSSQSA